MSTSQTYIIPSTRHAALRAGVILSVAFAIGCVLGFAGSRPVGGVLHAGLLCALASIPVVLLAAVVQRLLTRAAWAKHTYAWYRETFPENAHVNGHVSCRHCGSHNVRVNNLMNQTFTRLHSCAQCGETLYFSPEKV